MVESKIKDIASLEDRIVTETDAEFRFFGDSNKVMSLGIQDEKWTMKTINTSAGKI